MLGFIFARAAMGALIDLGYNNQAPDMFRRMSDIGNPTTITPTPKP